MAARIRLIDPIFLYFKKILYLCRLKNGLFVAYSATTKVQIIVYVKPD
jgi:hypothetical protein